MREFTVILGDKEYIIEKLPARKASGWRKSLKGPLQTVVALIAQLSDAGADLQQVLDANISALAPMLEQIIGNVHDALDHLPDVVLEYSPLLQKDQERIDENATDEEFIVAFLKMVQNSYPFGILLERSEKIGFSMNAISKGMKKTSSS